MRLPFTPDQFFATFAAYNRALWPVAVGIWLAAAGALVVAWRNPAGASRWLTCFLAALWAWNAIAYHAILFTRVNPAAWLFAGLFAFEALLLLGAAVRRRLVYFGSAGPRLAIGVGLTIYSLAYPFLSAVSHPYPATPTFGVPCPTAILTIGALVTVRGGAPAILAVIPALWGLIGGSAAVVLAVPADYVLLGAGVYFLSLVSRS